MFQREDIMSHDVKNKLEKARAIFFADSVMGDKWKEVKRRKSNGLWDEWYCPYCEKWFLGSGLRGGNGTISTNCWNCDYRVWNL